MPSEDQSRYKQLARDLARRIAAGEWGDGDRFPSEASLTEHYDVSRITVRAALEELQRNRHLVSRGRKGRFVSRSNSSVKRMLVQADRSTVALMMPIHAAQWELAGIVQSVSAAVEETGRLVTVQCTGSDWRRERRMIEQAYRTHAAGILLYAADDTRNIDLLARLKLSGYPVTLIDSPSRQLSLPFVASDNEAGGILQAEALLDDAVCDAFYLVSADAGSTPLASRSSIRERYLGFLGELLRRLPDLPEYHDADLDNRLLTVDRELLNRTESGRRINGEPVTWAERWLERVDFPVGVACLNDGVARWLITYLDRRGVRVPGEVRVIGFDNAPVHVPGRVTLSSVQQDFVGMGRAAADLLLRQISGDSLERDAVRLPVRLVLRETTLAAEVTH